jgi:hypothetical protein
MPEIDVEVTQLRGVATQLEALRAGRKLPAGVTYPQVLMRVRVRQLRDGRSLVTRPPDGFFRVAGRGVARRRDGLRVACG